MSDIREEAQAEAERRWPMDAVYTLEPTFTARELHAYEASAFLAGAVWADARKVEVTEDMVERAARAIQGATEPGTPWEDTTERVRIESRYEAHCALVAALGGEQE